MPFKPAPTRAIKKMITICAGCHCLQDSQGNWQSLPPEELEPARLNLSHGLCPDCVKKLYPEYFPD